MRAFIFYQVHEQAHERMLTPGRAPAHRAVIELGAHVERDELIEVGLANNLAELNDRLRVAAQRRDDTATEHEQVA